MTLPNGRSVTLPAGVTEKQVQAIFQKRTSGQEVSTADRAILRQVFQGMGGGAGGARRSEGGRQGGGALQGGSDGDNDNRFSGRYIVFVRRDGKPVAINVTTGLTDLDYTEVVSGLSERDSVLILPSASLVQAQKEFNQRMQRMTGGGIPGMTSQNQPGSTKAPAATSGEP